MGRRKTKINVIPNSDQWQQQRNALIGASEISTLFQRNKWNSAHNLLAIKAGIHEQYPPSFRMQVGHYFEESIGKLTKDYSHRAETYIDTMERDNCIRLDYELPYVSASLDFKGKLSTGAQYVLDAKCVGINSYRTLKSTNVPSYTYWLQIQQQLMVTERSLKSEVGFLSTWAGNQMLKVFEIYPCVHTHSMIRYLASFFNSKAQELLSIPSYDDRISKWMNTDFQQACQTHYDFVLADYNKDIDELIRNTSSLYLLVE